MCLEFIVSKIEKNIKSNALYVNVFDFFCCAPDGAHFLRVQVPNLPGSGKDIAEGKGVAGDCKSERSRMWGTY